MNINGQSEKERIAVQAASVAASIAFDLECWTDGLYPWTASQSKHICLQKRVNSLHWPDPTAPLRVILSHFAPKRKARWGQDWQVGRDHSN